MPPRLGAGCTAAEFHMYNGMGHSSCPQELRDLREFLLKVLPEEKTSRWEMPQPPSVPLLLPALPSLSFSFLCRPSSLFWPFWAAAPCTAARASGSPRPSLRSPSALGVLRFTYRKVLARGDQLSRHPTGSTSWVLIAHEGLLQSENVVGAWDWPGLRHEYSCGDA
jgi:hypothetical protein